MQEKKSGNVGAAKIAAYVGGGTVVAVLSVAGAKLAYNKFDEAKQGEKTNRVRKKREKTNKILV